MYVLVGTTRPGGLVDHWNVDVIKRIIFTRILEWVGFPSPRQRAMQSSDFDTAGEPVFYNSYLYMSYNSIAVKRVHARARSLKLIRMRRLGRNHEASLERESWDSGSASGATW